MDNMKFSGRVVGEPELRYTPAGKAILTFSVSVYTGGNKDAGYQPSMFFRVDVWDEAAVEISETLKKGDIVTVTGRAKPPRTYTKDGETRSAGPEVTASDVTMGDAFRDQPSDDQVPF